MPLSGLPLFVSYQDFWCFSFSFPDHCSTSRRSIPPVFAVSGGYTYAKNLLKIGDEYIHESYIGSTFVGKVEKETVLDGHKAIIPSIQGWAKVYGRNTITIDTEDDPYAHGFQVI